MRHANGDAMRTTDDNLAGENRRIPAVMLFLVFVVALPLGAQEQSPAKKKPEQFTATAFGQAGMFAGKSVDLNIYVNDYSSDQEVQDLKETLQEKGSDALLSKIVKLDEKGRVAATGYTGWRIPVVRQRPTQKGRRIVLFSDRPIGFYEARNAPRSKSYEFGLLILNVDDKGQGDGLLYGACKIKFNKDNQIELEHYGQQPARLANVRLWK
jgi:hypothetical protein